MTMHDYAPYVAHARQQAKLRREQASARYEEAWHTTQRIAEFLRREYQPTRIVVFGSLVHPEVFGLHSDIDIAVEGIPWPAYLRAWNEIEELAPEFKVDLIDMAIVSDRLRQRITDEGQAI
jgi:predicted nucleotidyltransferase